MFRFIETKDVIWRNISFSVCKKLTAGVSLKMSEQFSAEANTT